MGSNVPVKTGTRAIAKNCAHNSEDHKLQHLSVNDVDRLPPFSYSVLSVVMKHPSRR